MSAFSESFDKRNQFWLLGPAGIAALIIVAVSVSNLHRTRPAADKARLNTSVQTISQPHESGSLFYQSEDRAVMLAKTEPPAAKAGFDVSPERKMIRTSSVDMVVQKPAETAEKIRALAEGLGGFLVSSELSGGDNATGGSMTIRVPAARFEEARTAIRKLGLRVESEKVEAQDVTRQYVDQEAYLRNLRAEEAQFLAILKHATTVKDTLEVSQKLSGVRGEIDRQQAEFDTLSKQIETVAIAVSLRAQAEAQVFGLNWRPLYQLKLALRDGLDAIAEYGSSMVSFLFYLPVVLLWTATIILGAAVSWKVLRWTGRTFFAWPKGQAQVVQNG